MTDRDIMQQALEALENGNVPTPENVGKNLEAITALRERLAQPEQEPVLQEIDQYRMQMAVISIAAKGYWKEGDDIDPDYDTTALRDVAGLYGVYAKYDALYKAQPEQDVLATRFGNMGHVGWLESPDGAFRANPLYKIKFPSKLLSWQVPLYAALPEQEPFEDLATELFVIAQISPADDGFSDTIERIESWLREHFSTPPQRKREWVGLTDEEIWETVSRIGTSDSDVNPYAKLADARAIEAKLKEKNNG